MAGPQCCSNPPTLNPSSGEGHVEKIGGLDSYVSGSPNTKLAIILTSEVFGYEAPILRKIADKVAAAGFLVVVPDFLHGDPFVYDNPNRPLPVWLEDHQPYRAFEEAKQVIEDLKSKGVSAIGAAGFCWGAKVVVELSKIGLILATVVLHPSFVTLDDIKGVGVPIAILGAEIDQYSPLELLKQFEEILATKSEAYIDFEISEGEFEITRELYERLIDRTKHLKVWISYAKFEASAMEEDDLTEEQKNQCVLHARRVFEKAINYYRTSAPELKEERAMLLEEWLNMEVNFGEFGDVSLVQAKLPKKLKKRRQIVAEDGPVGLEEYINYMFPEETQTTNLKILEAAYKWKKQKVSSDED